MTQQGTDTELSERAHRICSRCVMDTTDPEITFDDDEICNHCRTCEAAARQQIGPREEVARQLAGIVQEIKRAGRDRDHDCIVGVSGGVDSTYLAYKAVELGLRPLAVHFDNGWDSELAVKNIEGVLRTLEIDLYTYVVNWDEFKDLQISFLRASVPDIEIPTDHGIGALLYRTAAKTGLRYILTGANTATETVLPKRWATGHADWRYISAVHQRFGSKRLKTFPHVSRWAQLYYRFVRKVKFIPLLDYVDYNKQSAMDLLRGRLGWRDYGGKHHESIYTRFLQGYILPHKFGIEKRKAHLSALICSGQITRDQALRELARREYTDEMARSDRTYVVKKLGLSDADFEALLDAPPRTYLDYPTYEDPSLYHLLIRANRLIRGRRSGGRGAWG